MEIFVTTYNDLTSLGPSQPVAELRCKLLKLDGTNLWEDGRLPILANLLPGDVVRCRPSALPFWRGAPFGVIVQVIEDPPYEDPIRYRYGSWLVWALVQEGLESSVAKALVKSPPKSDKHQHWDAYQRGIGTAVAVLDAPRQEAESVAGPPLSSKTSSDVDDPFSWRVASNNAPKGSMSASYIHDLEHLLKDVNSREIVGVDVETDIAGAEPNEVKDTLVGLSLVVGNKGVYYTRELLGELWPLLQRARLVGANIKYDLTVMTRAAAEDGYELSFTKDNVAGDSMVAAYLLCLPSGRLKDTVKSEYGHTMMTYDDVTGGGKLKISEVDPKVTASYCVADAWWAKKLEADLWDRMVAEGSHNGSSRSCVLYKDVDLPLIPVLVGMELRGMRFDRDKATLELNETIGNIDRTTYYINMRAKGTGFSVPDQRNVCRSCRNGKKKRATCTECSGVGALFSHTPVNPGSGQQISQWLFGTDKSLGHLGLPIQRVSRKTKTPSTDSLSLLRSKDLHPVVGMLLSYKHLVKYRGYLESWLEESERDGRLHSVFSNATVVSGRLSSKEPNLQQVSGSWRSMFTASEGKVLLAADESQFEVRIAAFQSRDPQLMKLVNAPSGTFEGDLHAQTMYHVFGIPISQHKEFSHIRQTAKVYNFMGLFYGAKPPSLVERIEKLALENPELNIKIPTVKEAAKALAGVKELYKVYSQEYVPTTIARARDRGNIFYTAFGRPRVIDYLTSGYKEEREAGEREGVNHTIQGTAADLMRKAMNLADTLEHGSLLAQNHDELIFDVDPDWLEWYTNRVRTVMELGQPLEGVPLVVDIRSGPTWAK